MDLQTIREAIATTVRTGVQRAVNCSAYDSGNPQFPYMIVRAGGGEEYLRFHETWDKAGVLSVRFTLEVGVAARNIDAQVALDDMLSVGAGKVSSIVDALRADKTLGGAVTTVKAVSAMPPANAEAHQGAIASIVIDVYP